MRLILKYSSQIPAQKIAIDSSHSTAIEFILKILRQSFLYTEDMDKEILKVKKSDLTSLSELRNLIEVWNHFSRLINNFKDIYSEIQYPRTFPRLMNMLDKS